MPDNCDPEYHTVAMHTKPTATNLCDKGSIPCAGLSRTNADLIKGGLVRPTGTRTKQFDQRKDKTPGTKGTTPLYTLQY